MRSGLNTIQQTLAPEAASVLSKSIAAASSRGHGQTTPLHVAAMLLRAPSGFLRQACIRSHPNSSHPLQCRALELCFRVALDRLPTAQNSGEKATGTEPPISNALMAALKRAQAHQRRGCPEQQQQPLLAVKVELEQLVISILDDPSVSRVMREASFSSTAVKVAIEQSLNSSNVRANQHQHLASGNTNFMSSVHGMSPQILSNPSQLPTQLSRLPSPVAPPLANRNLYLNPRLQQQQQLQTPTTQVGHPRDEDVKNLVGIMSRREKRNPVLVGDSDPKSVVKKLFQKIQNNDFANDLNWKNVQIITIEQGFLLSDKNQVTTKIDEISRVIESKIENGGMILDLGDLRWLVEQPAAPCCSEAQQQHKAPIVTEAGRILVLEISKLLARFGADSALAAKNKLWLIGTATCETYLRCQVYHPTMESDWGLQVVPIASRSPIPTIFPRLGSERLLSNTLEFSNQVRPILSPLTPLPENVDPARKQPVPSSSTASCGHIYEPLPVFTSYIPENSDPSEKTRFGTQCSVNYEKDVRSLADTETSLSRTKQDAPQPSLPAWLQNAKLDNPNAEATDKSQQNSGGLLSEQKTREMHKKWSDACFHYHPDFRHITHLEKFDSPDMPAFQTVKANTLKPVESSLQLTNAGPDPTRPDTPPATRTRPTSPVRTDLILGTTPTGLEKPTGAHYPAKDLLSCISSKSHLDAAEYKKLLKSLMEKAWWQAEAVSAVASAVTCYRHGNGRHRSGSRGDVWMLFAGPDRVAKRKIASVLGEQISGSGPVVIGLGRQEPDAVLRGRTAVDRIAEAVRRNPASVIVLQDFNEANVILRGNVIHAIERGRLADSHGREVGLGSAVFIVTGDWSTVSSGRDEQFVDEQKLNSTAGGSWQLGLIVREKTAKRRGCGSHDERPWTRSRLDTGALCLDLNLTSAADYEDRPSDSSVVTAVEEAGPANGGFSIALLPHDLASCVDETVVFGPVEAGPVRREIRNAITAKFSADVGERVAIEIGDDVLDKILGGVWHDGMSLERWVEEVVGPSFAELRERLPGGDRREAVVVRLVVESDMGRRKGTADWLPSSIFV